MCNHYQVSSLQILRRIERWWLSMPGRIKYDDENLSKVDNKDVKAGWRHYSRPLNNDFGQIFFQSRTRNQNVPLSKKLFNVNNKAPEQGMKIVKRYQQRHQNDVKKMFCWFYYQHQTRSTHNPSAPFFDSEQTNAENIDTAWRFRDIPKVDREETAALHEGHGYSFLIVNFGKPSSNQWHEPDHPRQYIQKWHAQSRVRRLQWSVANAVLQSCLKSRLGTSPCMTPNAIQIKNCR